MTDKVSEQVERWSFDDQHVGTINAAKGCLATRIIPRPPKLTANEWHSHASAVATALNNRPDVERSLIVAARRARSRLWNAHFIADNYNPDASYFKVRKDLQKDLLAILDALTRPSLPRVILTGPKRRPQRP
ncbi:hypothetical protein QQS45_08280 [Alteriqipengyuania flavescens]|uniref:hypothetical protein n=1 Tax=Alteriqipengyuania flavescens TaxID=3053610 RepID=UPI0025B3EC40|nr:hypothetical protein [Alteriqipengyuania flavescens]WJY17644.1 hypothetical protein QQW98_08275 [Alteriqipengyuania flavescens]WJY23587.1 hypothetical protein QQS45_08280 [Alteriqipengyuania flavescens]